MKKKKQNEDERQLKSALEYQKTEMLADWEDEKQLKSSLEQHIVLNRIRTPDGTILTSYNTHDFVIYKDRNGREYMVDGGLEYLKRYDYSREKDYRGKEDDYEELSVTTEAPFEIVRQSMHWGTYGKSGSDPIRYVPVCKMSDEHINAILEKNMGANWVRNIFKQEIIYRKKHNISIHD